MDYGVKNGVGLSSVFIVNLYTFTSYSVYMELLYGIHLSAFSSGVYNFHYILYRSNSMTLLQQMLCKT
jgi:hypothetical protein